jgi:ATP-dependent exoDNAse (exonuclease V) alpha subunit
MLVSNDPQGRWVNGSLGRVRRVLEWQRGEPAVEVELEGGEVAEVRPHTWELYELYLERGELRSRVVGRYTQLPLILGWAVTIHKAQGKTFSRVVVDLGRGAFAPGQVYVALSRCTSLEGLVLRRPITRRHIFYDRRVAEFLTAFQYRQAEATLPVEKKRELVERAIREGKALRIVYLKPNDEKSGRVVWPREVGEVEYRGRTFLGLKAYCSLRGEERTFRLDRVLHMEMV